MLPDAASQRTIISFHANMIHRYCDRHRNISAEPCGIHFRRSVNSHPATSRHSLPSWVVQAQQRRRDRPGATDQPSVYGHRKVTAYRSLSENARENGTVTAHLARHVERGRLGFAVAAVRPDDDRIRIVGIRMEPCNCQVAALMSSFRSRTRLVTAARARPRHSH